MSAEDWSGNVTNNNININTANGSNSNNGNNIMTSNNSCSSDVALSSSIVGGCSLELGSINNNDTSPKSSSNQQHMHHHSSATAFSAAAGFWSAAYQGKKIRKIFFVDCVVLVFLYFSLFVC